MTENSIGRGEESGKDYLERIGKEYQDYGKFLPGLSDEAFAHQRSMSSHRDGVEGFLSDFAIAAEERRRNIVRWKVGEKLPAATPEKISQIRTSLPRFVVFNAEAVGGMRTSRAERFKVDVVSEDIMTEVARRLPRTLDAYRYHQDYATDKINIPGMGQVDVTLSQTADGIFSTINSIETSTFRIWNCRESGVKYLDRYNEISRPMEIEIKPRGIKLSIYGDGSGLQRENRKKFESLQDQSVVWLVDNALKHLRKAPLPKKQIDVPPMDEPFPEGKVGPLFAFVEEEAIEKIEILKHGIERAYPDERYAVSPSWRLVPLGYNMRGYPPEVHDGFIWCGVGKVDEMENPEKVRIAHKEMDTWSHFSREGMAEIKPLVATDVFIVDWQAWHDYRDKTFTETHDTLTDNEVGDMYRAVAKTFVPITKYKGGYKQPVVLIARKLEVNEIGKTYTFPRR